MTRFTAVVWNQIHSISQYHLTFQTNYIFKGSMSGEEWDYWLSQGLKTTCGQLVFQYPNAVTLNWYYSTTW